MKVSELKNIIRDVPDFPKEGILFKDITTLLKDKDAFKKAVDAMAKGHKKGSIDQVVCIESRGFIFGAALAYKLGAGFVPVRKKGKLPAATRQMTYDLEYGTDTLEIHADALRKGERILIVDDLLATGGTMKAVVDLCKAMDVDVGGIVFLIELRFLKGKKKLKDVPFKSVIKF